MHLYPPVYSIHAVALRIHLYTPVSFVRTVAFRIRLLSPILLARLSEGYPEFHCSLFAPIKCMGGCRVQGEVGALIKRPGILSRAGGRGLVLGEPLQSEILPLPTDVVHRTPRSVSGDLLIDGEQRMKMQEEDAAQPRQPEALWS